ncbi:ferrochelatase [Maricaulis sp.]|uniref:ferrochelatase n=1 Tax=Maricaulis sp. TaxID=1486257 RepID=UPI003A8FAD24
MARPGGKLAIVLFNLGGPDGPEAVKPFLRNLFRDPAIIGAPAPVREGLAWLISTLRAKPARANYAKMGGGSPLLPETRAQIAALEPYLAERFPDRHVRIWPAMRYWPPFTEDVAREVTDWQPDETVLLPLYPHFSTTTTGSSLGAWRKAGGPETHTVCCYPVESGFVKAHADAIRDSWQAAGAPQNARLLFSAHGLPEKVIAAGDPYQWQIEQTAAAVAALLPELPDWQVCYQSRVGPMKWIGPSTDDAVRQAGADARHVVLTPIAFVSEHIETLVELDEEYAELAEASGVAGYSRVPALGTTPGFIEALVAMIEQALASPRSLAPAGGTRLCPASCPACPNAPNEV